MRQGATIYERRLTTTKAWRWSFSAFTLLALSAWSFNVYYTYRTQTEGLIREAGTLSAMLAERTAADLESARDGLQSLAKIVVLPEQGGLTSNSLKLAVQLSPMLLSTWLVKRDGAPWFDEQSDRPNRPSATNRSYFQAHLQGSDTYIGPTEVGTVTNRKRFIISVRISDDNNDFGGVVAAGIDVKYFERIFMLANEQTKLGIVLRRAEGDILVSWPPLADGLSDIGLANKNQAIAASSAVGDLPLIITTHAAHATATAGWQRVAMISLLPLVSVIACFGWLTSRGIQAAAKNDLARIELAKAVAETTAQLKVALQELNHRVKNNLQLVSSLVRLASMEIKDRDAAAQLERTSQRIAALADVHKLLEEGDAGVRLDSLCNGLVDRLSASFLRHGQRFSSDICVPPIIVSANVASALGIALNEIITNAFKHGFRQQSDCRLTITYTKSGSHHAIEVSDNGPGVQGPQKTSVGTRIVDAVLTKLDGTLQYESGASGTHVKLVFTQLSSIEER